MLHAASEISERFSKLVELLWSRWKKDSEELIPLPDEFRDVVRTLYINRHPSRSTYRPRSWDSLMHHREHPFALAYIGASCVFFCSTVVFGIR